METTRQWNRRDIRAACNAGKKSQDRASSLPAYRKVPRIRDTGGKAAKNRCEG
jgi:hypothetical protein